MVFVVVFFQAYAFRLLLNTDNKDGLCRLVSGNILQSGTTIRGGIRCYWPGVTDDGLQDDIRAGTGRRRRCSSGRCRRSTRRPRRRRASRRRRSGLASCSCPVWRRPSPSSSSAADRRRPDPISRSVPFLSVVAAVAVVVGVVVSTQPEPGDDQFGRFMEQKKQKEMIESVGPGDAGRAQAALRGRESRRVGAHRRRLRLQHPPHAALLPPRHRLARRSVVVSRKLHFFESISGCNY